MQLGITIPLQKFMRIPAPPYGEQADLLYCWELHRLEALEGDTFIAVNASNRYTLVFMGMQAADWRRLEELLVDAIAQSFSYEGYTSQQVDAYLLASGQPHQFTKTHGRKSVAGLNRAVDVFEGYSYIMDDSQLYQLHLSMLLNNDSCHAAGFPGEDVAHPYEYLARDLERVGIISAQHAANILAPVIEAPSHTPVIRLYPMPPSSLGDWGKTSDIEALRNWSKTSESMQEYIENNAYCPYCKSTTTIKDYSVVLSGDHTVLQGFCAKCGGRVSQLAQ